MKSFKPYRIINCSRNSLLQIILITFLLASLNPGSTFSQVNIKIGYAGAYMIAPNMNHLIGQYNSINQTILNEKMDELRWSHGIDMGLRYAWNVINFELSWESKGNTLSAIEILNEAATEKNLYLRLNNLALGTEIQAGKLGVGATIEQAFVKLQTDLSGTSKRNLLATTRVLNSKIFLSLHIPGTDILSFVFRPYYAFQWHGSLSLDSAQNYLGVPGSTGLSEKFGQIGISLSFYNGKQKDF